MAIQNFLSGGFYGKLGDVVGQRWHNKRIIRTHVIPFNPRTELQQSNRAQFALATKLAQEAYNINKGSPLWDTTNMGQFSLMVSTAKRRLQAGKTPAEALPLYPDGYDPSIILTNPSIAWSSWPQRFTITDNSYIFTQNRSFSVEIHCKDERLGEPVFISSSVTIPAGSQFSFSYTENNTNSFPPGSSFQAISTDDALHGGVSIQFPVFPITQTTQPSISVNIVLDKTVLDQYRTTRSFIWTVQNYRPLFEIEQSVRYYNLDTKSWSSHTIGLWSEEPGIANSQVEVYDEFSYPAGSYIFPDNVRETTPTAFIHFIWPQVNFTVP